MRRDPYYCIIIWVLLLLAVFPRCGKPGFEAIKKEAVFPRCGKPGLGTIRKRPISRAAGNPA